MGLCDPDMHITLAFQLHYLPVVCWEVFFSCYIWEKKKKKIPRLQNQLQLWAWCPDPMEPAQLSLPAWPPAYSDSTSWLQTLIPCGYLQPPPNHRRKQQCLPISCAGFIKYVLWFKAKVHSAVLSVFIPVFHILYQLSPSDLWALRRLSHTNKAFIYSKIYNQATKPPHLASI